MREAFSIVFFVTGIIYFLQFMGVHGNYSSQIKGSKIKEKLLKVIGIKTLICFLIAICIQNF